MFSPQLPKDPHLLLSMVNMKLRNEFEDLEDLVHHYQVDYVDLVNQLALQGYVYNPNQNQFIHIEAS